MNIPTVRASACLLTLAVLALPSAAGAAASRPSSGLYVGRTSAGAITFKVIARGTRVGHFRLDFETRCESGAPAKRTVFIRSAVPVRGGRFSAGAGPARVAGRFAGRARARGTFRITGRDPVLGRCDTGTVAWTARRGATPPLPSGPHVGSPAGPSGPPQGAPAPGPSGPPQGAPPPGPPVPPPPPPSSPPRFPSPFSFTQTTSFEYDTAGRLAGATTTIDVTSPATDPDGDPLTYTWTASNGQISSDGLTATWTRPIVAGRVQGGDVTVTVSDGRGGTDAFTIEFR